LESTNDIVCVLWVPQHSAWRREPEHLVESRRHLAWAVRSTTLTPWTASMAERGEETSLWLTHICHRTSSLVWAPDASDARSRSRFSWPVDYRTLNPGPRYQEAWICNRKGWDPEP